MTDTPEAAEIRYEEFLETVRRERRMWGLRNDSGFANWEDDEVLLIPMWSQETAAAEGAEVSFPAYRPTEISLQTFLDTMVEQLTTRDTWVSVNPTGDMAGIDVPAERLGSELVERRPTGH